MNDNGFRALMVHHQEQLEAELTAFARRQPEDEILRYAGNLAQAATRADVGNEAGEMVQSRLALYGLLTILRQIDEAGS